MQEKESKTEQGLRSKKRRQVSLAHHEMDNANQGSGENVDSSESQPGDEQQESVVERCSNENDVD